MTNKVIYKEAAAALSVLAILAGLPFLLWYWRNVYVPGKYPPGTQIIHLTAVADGGIWTRDPIVGYSYWWKTPTRVKEIELKQGSHVVLFLSSPDVQHAFSLPNLHVGPVPVPAGHTVEVGFTADHTDELNFACTQVCGRDHSKLAGQFVDSQSRSAQH